MTDNTVFMGINAPREHQVRFVYDYKRDRWFRFSLNKNQIEEDASFSEILQRDFRTMLEGWLRPQL